METVIRDDKRLQTTYSAVHKRVQVAVDAVAHLEQRLVSDGLLSAPNNEFVCNIDGCTEVFTREHRLRRHQHVAHARPGQLMCIAMHCQEYFDTRDALDKHVVSAHPLVAERREQRRVKNKNE